MSIQSVSLKVVPMIAGLALTLAGASQAQYPSVEARAYTMGLPGAYNTYVGPLAQLTPATATADPAEVTWTSGSAVLRADAYSITTSALGLITATAESLAETANGLASDVVSDTYGRYYERLKVESSLPAGTPVTLVFRHDVEISSAGSGFYSGNVQAELKISGSYAITNWSFASGSTPSEPSIGRITVNTTVGSYVYVRGTLTTEARSHFYVSGPKFSGTARVDAAAGWHLEDAPVNVWVVKQDNTVVYPQP